ncbi:hypothetical protein RN001_003301 [Aquatica leii]|uniref:EF-hand domain-containing protein n=2 Tax=Endopterygota TaxID=33392 RepID=A0AAN7QBL0_9COLE|nr:hypothetical protein RN001_003301 [Aquatica leii]
MDSELEDNVLRYIPQYLRNLLKVTGYLNYNNLNDFCESDIEHIETFARDILHDSLIPESEFEQYYGIFKKAPKKFQILPGDKKSLLGIVQKLKSSGVTQTCPQCHYRYNLVGTSPTKPRIKPSDIQLQGPSNAPPQGSSNKNKQKKLQPPCKQQQIHSTIDLEAENKSVRIRILNRLSHDIDQEVSKGNIDGKIRFYLIEKLLRNIKTDCKMNNSGLTVDSMVGTVTCGCNAVIVIKKESKNSNLQPRWLIGNYYKHFAKHFKEENILKKTKNTSKNSIINYFHRSVQNTTLDKANHTKNKVRKTSPKINILSNVSIPQSVQSENERGDTIMTHLKSSKLNLECSDYDFFQHDNFYSNLDQQLTQQSDNNSRQDYKSISENDDKNRVPFGRTNVDQKQAKVASEIIGSMTGEQYQVDVSALYTKGNLIDPILPEEFQEENSSNSVENLKYNISEDLNMPMHPLESAVDANLPSCSATKSIPESIHLAKIQLRTNAKDKFSRTNRTKRKLLKIPSNQTFVTGYFPLIQHINDLLSERKELKTDFITRVQQLGLRLDENVDASIDPKCTDDNILHNPRAITSDFIQNVKTELQGSFNFPRENTSKLGKGTKRNYELLSDIMIEETVESSRKDAMSIAKTLGIRSPHIYCYNMNLKPQKVTQNMKQNLTDLLKYLKNDKCDDTELGIGNLCEDVSEEDTKDVENDLENSLVKNCNINSIDNGSSVSDLLECGSEDDILQDLILDNTPTCNIEGDTLEKILNTGSNLFLKRLCLKDYSSKTQKLNIRNTADFENGPFIRIKFNDNTTMVIRKSSLCWLLSTKKCKLSSDRLIRVKQGMIKSKAQESCELTQPTKQKIIRVGDWCVFKRVTSGSNSIIGRILSFKKLQAKGKQAQYDQTAVTFDINKGKVGALCNWYHLTENTITLTKSVHHEFYDVDNYEYTIPDPTVIYSADTGVSKCIVTPEVVRLMDIQKKRKRVFDSDSNTDVSDEGLSDNNEDDVGSNISDNSANDIVFDNDVMITKQKGIEMEKYYAWNNHWIAKYWKTMGNESSLPMELCSNFDADEIKRLGKRFRKLDLDNSGALSIDEFMSLPELQQNPLVQRVIDIFDADGNGEVDFKEFIQGVSQFSVKVISFLNLICI